MHRSPKMFKLARENISIRTTTVPQTFINFIVLLLSARVLAWLLSFVSLQSYPSFFPYFLCCFLSYLFVPSVIADSAQTELRIQLKLNTALLSTVRSFVRPCVTGVTSHISHIYKGINAMLIIRGPIKPYTF